MPCSEIRRHHAIHETKRKNSPPLSLTSVIFSPHPYILPPSAPSSHPTNTQCNFFLCFCEQTGRHVNFTSPSAINSYCLLCLFCPDLDPQLRGFPSSSFLACLTEGLGESLAKKQRFSNYLPL